MKYRSVCSLKSYKNEFCDTKILKVGKVSIHLQECSKPTVD